MHTILQINLVVKLWGPPNTVSLSMPANIELLLHLLWNIFVLFFFSFWLCSKNTTTSWVGVLKSLIQNSPFGRHKRRSDETPISMYYNFSLTFYLFSKRINDEIVTCLSIYSHYIMFNYYMANYRLGMKIDFF